MLASPIDQLLSRRSVAVRRLGEPGPSPQDLERILGAALTAPDHAGLRPWRLVLLGAAMREELAALFIAAKRKQQAELSTAELSTAEIEREQDKAMRPPVLIALVARPQAGHRMATEAEQMATAGAAMQNILLAAHFLGFGAIVLSGDRCQDPDIRARLGIQPAEDFLGFISIGAILSDPIPSRRPELADILTRL